MNLDTQLMEAIHKKIELSQQLERWEIDLETLIEIQASSCGFILIMPGLVRKNGGLWYVRQIWRSLGARVLLHSGTAPD